MTALTVDYNVIQREIGYELGYSRTPANWTVDQTQDVEDIIRRGLSKAYMPDPTPLYQTGHEWSFLRPLLTIATVANTRTYALPAAFERLVGPLTHVSTDSQPYPPIVIVSPQRLRELGQGDISTGAPCEAAIQAIDSTNIAEQQWTLILHPTPDAVYNLTGQYLARQSMISALAPYPLGGPTFADLVLTSCLAVAEFKVGGQQGPRYQEFMSRLHGLITMDLRRGPQFLGYNGNRATGNVSVQSRADLRNSLNGDAITYNGLEWQG